MCDTQSPDFEITRATIPWIVLRSVQLLLLIMYWFILKRALSSYGARGKFGEHERSVARGDSREQL